MRLELGNNQNFNITLNTFSALATLIFAYTIYTSFTDRTISNISNGLNLFNTLFGNIQTLTSNFFVNHPNMKYYYNELYLNTSDYKESDRDKYLEQIYSFEILYDIDAIINYIDSYKLLEQNHFQIKIAEEKIVILIKKLFTSKIFIENWNLYKDTYALEWTKKYIDMIVNTS
jgi:hypothetical protein